MIRDLLSPATRPETTSSSGAQYLFLLLTLFFVTGIYWRRSRKMKSRRDGSFEKLKPGE